MPRPDDAHHHQATGSEAVPDRLLPAPSEPCPPAMPTGLAELLSGLSLDEFQRRYCGQTAVHIRGDDARFARVFGWPEVNRVSTYSRVSRDGLKLVYEKKTLARSELARLDYWLRHGATLICNNINDVDPGLDRFAATLEADLNTAVNINAYASYPIKQGFDLHPDQHDLFIVHTEGIKRWVVLEPTYRYPLHELGVTALHPPPASDARPYLECELTPGDVLYIPRGHWHQAVAVSPSVHLSVGPVARTPSRFLQWLVRELMKTEELFRQDLPVIDREFLGGRADDADLDAGLDAVRDRLHAVLEPALFKERFTQYCCTSMPLKTQLDYPRQWHLSDEIDPATVFRFRPGQKVVVHDDPSTGTTRLYCRGYTLSLRGAPAGFVDAMLGEPDGPITGYRIMTSCPAVTWEATRQALLDLSDHGVLMLSSDDTESC